jgi:hypothetical protein
MRRGSNIEAVEWQPRRTLPRHVQPRYIIQVPSYLHPDERERLLRMMDDLGGGYLVSDEVQIRVT